MVKKRGKKVITSLRNFGDMLYTIQNFHRISGLISLALLRAKTGLSHPVEGIHQSTEKPQNSGAETIGVVTLIVRPS